MSQLFRFIKGDGAVLAALLAILGAIFVFDGLYTWTQGESLLGSNSNSSNLISQTFIDNRNGPRKAEALKKNGGTEASEKAVEAGLAWLAKHQTDSGKWSNDCLGGTNENVCVVGNDCRGPGHNYYVAQTGLSLLALMAGGHFDANKKPYSGKVSKGLDWLVSHQGKDGGIYSDPGMRYMYEHGIATFALAEACAIAKAMKEPEPRYRKAAEAAVRFILDNQHDDGGWRYSKWPTEPSDSSVSGWQMLALKSAVNAELLPDDSCIQRAIEFFEKCENKNTGETSYLTGGAPPSTQATTGVGMIVHGMVREFPNPVFTGNAAKRLESSAQTYAGLDSASREKDDFYLWYNGTLGMFLRGEQEWRIWNEIIRERIISLQCNQNMGCKYGSWDPDPIWGGYGGRIYSTSLAVLTLEVYYRYSRDPMKPAVTSKPKKS